MARRSAGAPCWSSNRQKLSGLNAGGFTVGKSPVQKNFTLGYGLLEAAAGGRVKSFAFEAQHGFLMRGIEHELVAVKRAPMAGQFHRTIENAHGSSGGQQGELSADGLRRNGVIIEVKADIDGFMSAHGLDAVGGKGVQRRR